MTQRLLLAVLVLGASVPAVAQDTEDPRIAEARQRFDVAQAAFERSDYTLALEAFSDVFQTMEEVGHPNALLVLYNVARTNQRLGRDSHALEQYERYLREAATDAPNREAAARNAAELRRRAAMSSGDGGDAGGEAGGGGGISPVGLIIASVGGATAIVGAVLGGVALSESDAARAGCGDGVCPPGARDGIGSAQTLANVSDALLFGGLVVAATGVVLMFVLADDGSVEASAACGPTGCGAVVRGTF